MSSRLFRMTVAPTALLSILLALPIMAQQPGGEAPEEDGPPQVDLEDLAGVPPPVPPTIQAARLPPSPAPDKGRMSLIFEGNRRWCTFPDDRVVKPPAGLTSRGGRPDRNAVYTFGYQFTVAAVERTRPGETLLLFESPVFRTAVYRQAAKVGKGTPKPQGGPVIMEPQEQVRINRSRIDPASFIPWWQEQYRCTTLPEIIDLDLDPGTYDVYMAFDILLKSGNWTHRTIGFGTDIALEAGRTTRVDARANMAAGARRELEILGAGFADPIAPEDHP
jgi:hypothetical protein